LTGLTGSGDFGTIARVISFGKWHANVAVPSSVQRVASAFLAARSRTHIILILSGFILLRVFLSLRSGIIPQGDGLREGVLLGQFLQGQLTVNQLVDNVGGFLRTRSTQLLYPLLISPQPIIGWSVETHLLVLNTILGSVLVAASYRVAVRLNGQTYAVLVALLTCSMTGPYWIARFGLVDNLLYAALPLFGLSVIGWLGDRTLKSFAFMSLGTGVLALSRPEGLLVIACVTQVFVWKFLRRYFSRRAVTGVLLLSVATAASGAILIVRSSPLLHRSLLSNGTVSMGLAESAFTLFNQRTQDGSSESDRVFARYSAILDAALERSRLARERAAAQGEKPPPPISEDFRNLAYQMSTEALAAITAHPLHYLLKIPMRGLALLFPWTYQPWSAAHLLYEAVYTLFLAIGFVLLIRRGVPDTPILVLSVIPLSILFFLSAYGIDNDLKHRNGVLVGLNLIAPLGYFLSSRPAAQAL
jgi:hypothetical protein